MPDGFCIMLLNGNLHETEEAEGRQEVYLRSDMETQTEKHQSFLAFLILPILHPDLFLAC